MKRHSRNVVDAFRTTARRQPRAAALIDGDTAISFAELDSYSARVAALLRTRGIGEGDRVLILHRPTTDVYALLIALLRIGAVAMVVDVSASRALVASAAALAAPAAMVASPSGIALSMLVGSLRRIPLRLTTAPWCPGAHSIRGARALVPDGVVADVDDDAPALLTFTSGSTGEPKGAVRTHAILRAQLEALRPMVAAGGEVDLVSLPIVVLANLAAGATSILPRLDLRRIARADARAVLAQARVHRATRITVPPALLERLVASPSARESLRGVRRIVTGGGPVFPDIMARAGATSSAVVTAVYGSTEAEPIAHLSSDEITPEALAAMRRGAGLLAGVPVPEASVRILPLSRDAIDGRDIGEIAVAGAHVVPGYLDGRGDGETKIIDRGRVWHGTGDAGYFDDHGRLWLLGRVNGVVHDSRGAMFPFAVECAARMVAPGRRMAAALVDGRRALLVDGELGDAARRELAVALDWAGIDLIVDRCRLPVDRRHASKLDYGTLAARLAAGGVGGLRR